MSKNDQKLNAYLSKKIVSKNGKTFVNLICEVVLNNGRVVAFEVVPKFYNKKFDYLLKQNIDEVK